MRDKSGPERATKNREYDFLRTRVRLVTDKSGPERTNHQDLGVRFVSDKSRPENAAKTREYDLVLLRVGQKEPARQAGTICYG